MSHMVNTTTKYKAKADYDQTYFEGINLDIPQNIQTPQRQINKYLSDHRHGICNSRSNHQPIVDRQRSKYMQSGEDSQADKAHGDTVEDTPPRKLPWQGRLQAIVHCLAQTLMELLTPWLILSLDVRWAVGFGGSD
jgi:hypothetical protein